MTEALGSADPTLFAEIKQLNGGKVIPIIGTSAAISPAFYQAAARAVGAAAFTANFHADNLVTATSGPAYQAFTQALLAVKGKVSSAQTGNFTTYFTAPGAVHLYDGMNLAALAMVAAGSTDIAKWKPFITTIGDGVPGAVTVSSFAQGVGELKAGKKIRYVGPGRADELRRLPRLTRHLPDRHLQPHRRGAGGGQHQRSPAPRGIWMTRRRSVRTRLRARRRGARAGGVMHHEHSLASVGFGLITSAVLAIAAVGLHPPVRRHRRAQPGLRRGHDRGRFHRLLDQPGGSLDLAGAGWSRWPPARPCRCC